MATDKLFKQVGELNSDSSDRMNLVIRKSEVYDNTALFAEKKIPFECFTIIEFKKPNRDNYVYGDPKKRSSFSIKEIHTRNNRRTIDAKYNSPFYCYIIEDTSLTLNFILKEEAFTLTPDGLGYFRLYEITDYKAYVEVLRV